MAENQEISKDRENLLRSLVTMAVESWRFAKLMERLLTKADTTEQSRYMSQYRWFVKRFEDTLADVGMKIVDVEGLEFELGMAVTPLNIEEFDVDDSLIVDQMLEPIIMSSEGLVKTGTVMLRKAKQ